MANAARRTRRGNRQEETCAADTEGKRIGGILSAGNSVPPAISKSGGEGWLADRWMSRMRENGSVDAESRAG
ncbi:hypothetical protein Y886_18810 [Xanthomonas hyacinthi DSM 19077]|nr:hypothetical protein Y886_18810 [Xanthomonas hyacinthi DSM 19077]